MKVLAINSSLRKGGESRTELMMNDLVEGMREVGAEVEVVHLHQKKIKYCIGCFTCMTKTPGKCVHNDDMTNELFPKWLESDLVVYAIPLFHHTINAPMKTFIERTFPICEPFLEQDDSGRWVHPVRHKQPAVVVLSVCGFLEESAFEALSHYMNFLFHPSKPVAEIYRPASQVMTQPVYKDKLDDILDATRQAGRELVESMAISPQTMARIKQPIADVRSVKAVTNIFWKTCIAEGVIPKTFERKGMMPRPDSVETYMAIMSLGFNPQAAADTKAVLQFNFSGEVDGSCYFKIEKGTFEAILGTADNPDLTIKAPFAVWMDILTYKADGTQMFMEQKYDAAGDISLLMKLSSLFGAR
jgi:multimeric flavodoxin WrbA/putative sterol carrier protein